MTSAPILPSDTGARLGYIDCMPRIIRILHTSDLHGRYKQLLKMDEEFDVWLDTGDFFPNLGRVERTGFVISPIGESRYQSRWLRFKDLPRRIARWLGGRPALVVQGNHDFVSLVGPLRQAGANAVEIGPHGAKLGGLVFAGFRDVPVLQSEWKGESYDVGQVVNQTMASRPHILATHVPPLGVLDGAYEVGSRELARALFHRRHQVGWHFFGHEHHMGGQQTVMGPTRFVNGAGHAKVHEVETPG